MRVLAGVLFMVLGALLMGLRGALAGLCFGVLAGHVLQLGERLRALERELAGLRGTATPRVPPRPAAVAPAAPAAGSGAGAARRSPPPAWALRCLAAGRRFLTTGNVIAKAGVVVLFFGIAFLLRYALERDALPVELRLAGTGAVAVAMLGLGWRLRGARPEFARVVQGGGVGVLYLTCFAAARLYGVLPPGMAFAFMVSVVALSAVLAVLQDARALAVLGATGGFLAPVLVSAGAGDHVLLFGYYAVLNAGILGIAWFKAWRILNWLGFVFTFVIGTLWGVLEYRPALFASVEPFLLLFFAFYFALTILFAHRQPPRLNGYVDGTLVFGLPLVAFGLQAALVRDFELGRAFSALGLAAVYLGAAGWLWRRAGAGMRLLAEAFLALGVIFATLAIPFAVDGHWTAATWSVEGAGLVWAGVRQGRLGARLFGVLLQLGAGALFFAMAGLGSAGPPVLNSALLGSAFVALAGLLSARTLDHHAGALHHPERFIAPGLMLWAVLWWLGAGSAEIARHAPWSLAPALTLALLALSTLAAVAIAQRLDWRRLMQWQMLLAPALTAIALAGVTARHGQGPLAGYGALAWPAALLVSFVLLWRCERVWPAAAVAAGHGLTVWTSVLVAAWAAAWLVAQLEAAGGAWPLAAWGAAGAAAMRLIGGCLAARPWPGRAHPALYRGLIPAVLAAGGLGYALLACASAGDPAPLAHLPLLNPLALAQALVLLAIAAWYWDRGQPPARAWPRLEALPPALVAGLLGVAAFLLLNTELARAVHAYTGVPWRPLALLGDPRFQAGLSILWAVTALALMSLAARAPARAPWFAGAGLLAALVLKLFLLDLGDSGRLARSVSFLGAGALMLVMGYLAPLPPRRPLPERGR